MYVCMYVCMYIIFRHLKKRFSTISLKIVFNPSLEYNMGMFHKNGDGLELPFLSVEGSIRLERG